MKTTALRKFEGLYVALLAGAVLGLPFVLALTRGLRLWRNAGEIGVNVNTCVLLLAWTAITVSPLLPSGLGPARASPQEVWFYIDGPLGPGPVLRRRAVAWFTAAILASSTFGACWWLSGTQQRLVHVISYALVLASLVTLGALSSILRSPRQRVSMVLAVAITTPLLISATHAAKDLVALMVAVGVVAATTAAIVVTCGRVSGEALTAGSDRRDEFRSALVVGDLGALVPPLPASFFVRRASRTFPRPSRIPTTVHRDRLGLLRVWPFAAMSSCVIIGVSVVAGLSPNAALVGVSLFVAQAFTGPFAAGFLQRADQVGLDDLEAGSFARRLGGHLCVPIMSSVMLGIVGAALGIGLQGQFTAEILITLSIPGLAVCSRVWLAASGPAPLWLTSPITTTVGDFSGVVFIAWMARATFPALVCACVGSVSGIAVGFASATVVLVALATRNVVGLSRLHGH